MHICIVSHYCVPHVGGIELMAFQQAQQLALKGFSVTIVSSSTQGEVLSEKVAQVQIQRVKALNLLEQRIGVPYPIFFPNLLSTLKREVEKADICIIHGSAFVSSLIAAGACLLKRVPYIIYQYTPFVFYESSFLNATQRINDRLVSRFTLAHATWVAAVSQCTREYVKSLVSREVDIFCEAVDHRVFFPSMSPIVQRRRLGLPTEKFILLTTGRLVYKRSVETLLITAKLLRDDPRIYVIIVGNGSLRPHLEEYSRVNNLGNCRFVGSIPHALVAEYYRAADMFVLTSRTGEGLPISILEAWASALPVIATRGGGQEEIIKPGHNGFLVDTCAPTQIAQLISTYIDCPDLLRRIGENGRRTVLQSFTWEVHMHQLMSILKAAV